MVWSLADIRKKVRQVTGRFSVSDLTNQQLDDYINKYYVYTFPAEVKLEAKLTTYQFTTTPYEAKYSMPVETYTNFDPPATVNNMPLEWYQDRMTFVNQNTTQYTFSNPWTGDGATAVFTTTLAYPISPSTLTISDNTETFVDTTTAWTTSNISITGNLGGSATINLSTGVVSVTFNTPPISGQLIYLNYMAFSANRPQAILMYDNTFELYPVPDQPYIVKMGAYQVVTAFVNATDTPGLNEWGPCIAYGAARDIFSDYGENDLYVQTTSLYKEQVSYILTRTEQSLLNQRAMPNF